MTSGQIPWELAAGRGRDAASPEALPAGRAVTRFAARPLEWGEPDEVLPPASKFRTAVAFAELKAEIDAFLEKNYPGLSLAELRALAGSPAAHGTAWRSADRG
jgi:hypothetical protein